ncbi:hypothetical protein LXL04_025864 [Taraxacum kok-saghyz]
MKYLQIATNLLFLNHLRDSNRLITQSVEYEVSEGESNNKPRLKNIFHGYEGYSRLEQAPRMARLLKNKQLREPYLGYNANDNYCVAVGTNLVTMIPRTAQHVIFLGEMTGRVGLWVVKNIASRLVHIWVKTFRTCPHLGKNVPNLSTFGPSQRQLPIKPRSYNINLNNWYAYFTNNLHKNIRHFQTYETY